jgi:hypothetical protein
MMAGMALASYVMVVLWGLRLPETLIYPLGRPPANLVTCILTKNNLHYYSKQADRAYGTEISPRLLVISFVILLYAILYNICI